MRGRDKVTEGSTVGLDRTRWTCLSALTALPLFFFLLLHTGVAHEDCLSTKSEKLDLCSKAAVNLSITEDTLDSLVDTCRRVRQVAVCLDSVTEECQATGDPEEISILRNATLHWRRTFESLCNTILDLQTEQLSALSQGSSPQPLVMLIVAAALLTNFFPPACWSSTLFSSQGLPIRH